MCLYGPHFVFFLAIQGARCRWQWGTGRGGTVPRTRMNAVTCVHVRQDHTHTLFRHKDLRIFAEAENAKKEQRLRSRERSSDINAGMLEDSLKSPLLG